jgi:hypothetical protein
MLADLGPFANCATVMLSFWMFFKNRIKLKARYPADIFKNFAKLYDASLLQEVKVIKSL